MIENINSFNKKNKLKELKINKTREQKWNSIREYFSTKCGHESCWIEQEPLKNLNLKDNFRPKIPAEWIGDPKAWLSTPDIYKVMVQYEKVFPEFIFIGPVPSDCPNGFYCELSKLKLDKLIKNNNKIGIIFNLDKHNQPGSHWVATLINIPEKTIEYYDSNGEAPPKNINDFIKSLINKFKEKNVNMIYKINKKRHQYGGSECGIYSMNFLLERLYNVSFEDIEKKKISDRQMNNIRKILYRPRH